MNRYISLGCIPLFALLSGCVTQMVAMPMRAQRLTNYNLGEVKEVSVGDPIVTVENASVRDAYEVVQDFQAPSPGILNPEQPSYKKGDRFTVVGYDPQDPGTVFIREEGPLQIRLIGINADGTVTKGWVLTNGQNLVQGSWPAEKLFQKSGNPSRGDKSFKAQIIYSGMAGNTLKAAYREFANDYARPAFSQDLQYNLDEDKIISYKSVKIEIVKAKSSSLQYKVIDDGGLPWMP